MAIEKVDAQKCIGCEQCYQACYGDVFRMDPKTKTAVAQYREECAACCWCVVLCPADAIVFSATRPQPVFTSWG